MGDLIRIRVKVKDGYWGAGKRGVIFSHPEPGQQMAVVLMDGDLTPELWAWRVLDILGPDTRKPAGREREEEGACPTCGAPADIKTHWHQTEIDAAKWRARELGREIGWGGEEGAGGLAEENKRLRSQLADVLTLAGMDPQGLERKIQMLAEGSGSGSPHRAASGREAVARQILWCFQDQRTFPDGAWEEYDADTKAGMLQYADRVLALLGEAPPTSGEAGPVSVALLAAMTQDLYEFSKKSKAMLDIMQKQGFVIDNMEDRWQKLAFTLYSEVVDISERSRHLIVAYQEEVDPVDAKRPAEVPEAEQPLHVTPGSPPGATVQPQAHAGCHADRDGDCEWSGCPQLRDGEPKATGRHCPLDIDEDDEPPHQGETI